VTDLASAVAARSLAKAHQIDGRQTFLRPLADLIGQGLDDRKSVRRGGPPGIGGVSRETLNQARTQAAGVLPAGCSFPRVQKHRLLGRRRERALQNRTKIRHRELAEFPKVMDIRFISSLTPDDENRMAPALLAAAAALLDRLPIAYTLRFETVTGRSFQHRHSPEDVYDEADAVAGGKGTK
jgi:hypothetical protein